MIHPLTDADALRFLADRSVVHLAGVGPDGVALMRPLHTALLDGDLFFHGADGAKGTLAGQTVSVAGHEVVANLPSWFFHPTRACPATTWYVAAEVRGVLRPVEALRDKARALAALTARHQPEGGYAPITGDDQRYRAALQRLAVWRLAPATFRSRVKLGQHLPAARVAGVMRHLWRRGDPGDVEAIERIHLAHADRPWPDALRGPHGLRLLPAVDARRAAEAASLLHGAYWLGGQPPDRIAAAQRSATAWVGAVDAQGALVACARALSDRVRVAWIYDVVVAPAWRGRGVGAAVVRTLLDHPAVRDAVGVRLGTVDAAPFYERFGFETLGTLPGSVGPATEMRLSRRPSA